MWARTSIVVLAAGVAVLVLAGWTGGFPPHAPLFADNRPGSVVVDAELVIAVDVSNSMDPEEQALQREGYILGLTFARVPQRLAQRHQRQDRRDLFRMGL